MFAGSTIPKSIQDIDKIDSFKKQLKPHLFLEAFCKDKKQNYLSLILINVCDLYIHFIFVQSILIICPKLFKLLVSF